MQPDIAQMAFDAAMVEKAWRKAERQIAGEIAPPKPGSPDRGRADDRPARSAAASPPSKRGEPR